MPTPRPTLLILLLCTAGLVGCDTTATQPEQQIVVEAYLRAEAPLPALRLTRTVGANDTYDPREAAVHEADVTVEKLAGDESVVETTSYVETDSIPGVYAPRPGSPPIVEPGATYRLQVEAGGDRVTATTTVPDSVELLSVENDTTFYQSDPNRPPDLPGNEGQTAFTIEPPRAARERQNVYIFSVTSLLDFEQTPTDVLTDSLTRFYREAFDADEDSIESLRTASSGLLNEANFERNADGTLRVELPWLGVAFFGPNEVAISIVDDNYYDFLRSQQAQQGGFAPGEIPNVIERVEGGTGLFGSYAQAARPVLIRRPPSAETSGRRR
jgi:hypothetical protein